MAYRAGKSSKAKDITIISGDFDAKVAKDELSNVAADFSLGDRNKSGDRLIECWFKHHPGRLYTLTFPQHKSQKIKRNLIGFVLIVYFENSDSDNNPEVAVIHTKLKSSKKKTTLKLDIQDLKRDINRAEVLQQLNSQLSGLNELWLKETRVTNIIWNNIREILNKVTKLNLKRKIT